MAQFAGFVPVSGNLVGYGYVLTSLALILLLRQPYRQLDKPGSKGFFLAIIAIFLWPLSVGLNTFVEGLAFSMAIWNVRLLAAALVSIGWFLLAHEFTTHRLPSRTVLVLFGSYTLLGQSIAWSNQFHYLVLRPDTTIQNGVLLPEFGGWFWVQALVNYTLILGATGLLTTESLRSRGLRQRQSALLALAVVPPIIANLLTIFNIVETIHDLTPFGLIGSGLILSWALYRQEFLNVVPVGRNTAIGVMDDAVVTLDEDDRVVDCNGAARQLFEPSEDYYGLALREFFEPLPDVVLDQFSNDEAESGVAPGDIRGELSLDITGQKHHLSYTRSTVFGTGNTRLGQVFVFRDITELKHREEDLELLRQVLTRILRHNLRNKLNMIEGHAELLAEEHGDDHIDQIIAASNSLNAIGEKARHLEQIIQSNAKLEHYDLSREIRAVVDEIRDQHPGVTITHDMPESCRVRSSVGLPVVIDNLLENAAKHNTTPDPRVHVTVSNRQDAAFLKIEDNGPGIPKYELEVLEKRRETSLDHGSGIGLWIVRWWADHSDVSLTFEERNGTVVLIEFPEATVTETT